MAYFLKSGNTYKVTSKDAMDLHDALPAGNYVVAKDMNGNFYLEQIDSFTPIKKIYGDCLKNTDRIVRTFQSRDSSTGVMLTGEKGSGKTLLAKNISIKLAEAGVPTIVINAPWHGDAFNKLLQDIDQPCAVVFDEFEKVYDREQQESILTLLDGVFPSKKLFLLTCNDKYRVDQHMRNRPGRIFYMIDFCGLDSGFIREYCEDNLDNKVHIDRLCTIASLFNQFNFDMLKALVEDMNRYNEGPQETMRILNAKPEFDSGASYSVELFVDGKKFDHEIHPEVWDGNPLQRVVELGWDPDPNDNDSQWMSEKFNHEHLVTVDAKSGRFIFENKNMTVALTRVRQKTFSFDAF
jgi:hypothetical protein